MQKLELISWLQDQIRQWETFLDEFGRDRLEQPGVTSPWSMKDVAAHMTGWNRRLVSYIEAGKRGLPIRPHPGRPISRKTTQSTPGSTNPTTTAPSRPSSTTPIRYFSTCSRPSPLCPTTSASKPSAVTPAANSISCG